MTVGGTYFIIIIIFTNCIKTILGTGLGLYSLRIRSNAIGGLSIVVICYFINTVYNMILL